MTTKPEVDPQYHRELIKRAEDGMARVQQQANLPHLYGHKPYQWTLDFWRSRNRMKLIVGGNQISKAIPFNADIPTPSGYKKMGDLQVGDFVFGRDGSPTKIIGIPFIGEDHSFKITFDDGDSVVASKDHNWIVKGPEERFRKLRKDGSPNPNYGKWLAKSTLEVFNHVYAQGKPTARRRYAIPICGPAEYPDADLLIEPYMLGLLLGDGCICTRSNTLTINENDELILKYLKKYKARYQPGGHCYSIYLNGFAEKIRKLEIGHHSYNKFIHPTYLHASIEQRKQLLAGLMDTDGTVSVNGQTVSYSTVSEQLALNVKELVNSLGGIAQISKRKAGYKNNAGEYVRCRDVFIVAIWTLFNPFDKSERKKNRWQAPRRYDNQRIIYSIEPVGIESSKCITVDNADGSFLVGRGYIVTHNSSTLIRHAIDLATDKKKWSPDAGYFPNRQPKVIWYIYPDKLKIDEEFEEKWKREWLPRNEMRDHPVYGWKPRFRRNDFLGIEFKSGVNLYWKTWRTDNQSGTVDAVFVDEELPSHLYDELSRRLTTTDGMYCMAFTATLGQPFWYEVIELKGKKNERFPNAFKRCVSVYDCVKYYDGTPSSVWSEEKIRQEINKCSTDAAIKMRIFGRFSSTEGLVYPSFRRERNITPKKMVPSDWLWYGGVDIGTGGPDGHPAAISIVAVSPDFKRGRLVRFWRGPRDKYTNTDDILTQYKEMIKDLPMTANYYDWASKEFYLRSIDAAVPFQKPDKEHAFGEDLLNVLLKNQVLDLDDQDGIEDLAEEFETLRSTTAKTAAKDDGIDSLRYAISKIPWDLSVIRGDTIITIEKKVSKTPEDERLANAERMMGRGLEDEDDIDINERFDELNELMEF